MLSSKQKIACDALRAGDEGQEAARKAGVSAQLISKWKKQPEFLARLNGTEFSIIGVVVEQLGPLVPKAVAALQECLDHGNGTVKVKAACAVFDQLQRGVAVIDLLQQIAHLEGQVNELLAQGPAQQDPDQDSDDNGPAAPEPPALPGPNPYPASGGVDPRPMAS